MADLTGFNANEVEPQEERNYEVLPSGEYVVVITQTEMKTTQNGNGKYLKLTLNVLRGKHKGRYLWDQLNLENPNQQAVDIARATLSSICRAINVMTPNDSSELHNKPLVAQVGKDTYQGELKNKIKGYKKLDEGAPPREPEKAPPIADDIPF